MTGREHYEAAERLLRAEPLASGWRISSDADVAKAQVHATLALAAAITRTGPLAAYDYPVGPPGGA